MKAYTVGEFKTHFRELVELVKKGEKIEVLYGKSKHPVAMLVPIEEDLSPRLLGPLDGQVSFQFLGSGKLTTKEFLG